MVWREYLSAKARESIAYGKDISREGTPKSIKIKTEYKIRFEEVQERLSEVRRKILHHMLNAIVKCFGNTLKQR